MSREAMKLALEVLEDMPGFRADIDNAITALREALAEPDFWEGYVPEPTMYLESGGLGYGPAPERKLIIGYVNKSEQPVKPATEQSSEEQPAQQALDKKAENAKELGLDYEPAQQEQNRQIDQLIQERDHRDEIIDKLCDAVLGPDRYEWSSQYFFEDAVREVEERMAEQPAQQDSACNNTLRAQGKAYPRTCKKCGFGPCVGLAQQALDKMAENARELGLDYEPAQQEPDRVKFERHWRKTRGDKKANRELPRHPLQPQTYIQDSANRHWVTWQAAVRSVAPPAQRKPLTDEEIDELRSGYQSGRIGSFVALARAIEAKLRSKNEDRN